MASYAVLSNPQFVNAIADDDEPTPELTTVIDWVGMDKSVPAANASVPTTSPISTIQLQYPSNGDMGVTMQRTEGLNIEIKKDGTLLYSIPMTDKDAVKDNLSYPNYVDVKLPAEIKEPGTYEVSVPKDAFLVKESDVESYTATDGTVTANAHVKLYNTAQTFTFTVKYAPTYTVSVPTSGDVLVGDLDVIKITYEEGTQVSLRENAPVVAFNRFQSGKDTQLTTYTVAAEGNVVTLTAADPSKIAVMAKTSSKYYNIQVPEGAWNVNGDTNFPITFSPYGVAAFVQSQVQTNLVSGEVTVDDLLNIKVTFPNKVTIASTAVYSNLLKITVGSQTIQTYLLPKEVSANGRTVTFVPVNMSSVDNSAVVKQWISGKLTLQIAANAIQDERGNKNPAFTWSNIEYKSTSTSFGPTAATNIYPANMAKFSTSGYYYFGVTSFLFNVLPNDDSKVITLKRNGETVFSWKPSQASTSSSKMEAYPTAGKNAAYFFPYDEEGKDITWTPEMAGYGTFTITVPAGAFKSAADENVTTEEITWSFINVDPATIPQPTIAEGGPAFWNDAKEFPNISGLSTFTIVYPEGCTVKWNKPTVTNMSKYSGRITKIEKTTTSIGLSSNITNTKVECDGNKAVFTFTPVTDAINPYSAYFGVIPADYLVITDKDGNLYTNEITRFYWRNTEPVKGTLGYLVTTTENDKTTYTWNENFPTSITTNEIADKLGKFEYLGIQSIYLASNDANYTGSIYLENAETGKRLEGATFTKTKESNATGAQLSGKMVTIKCTTPLVIPAGKYNLVIAPNAFGYGGADIATPENTSLGFGNPEWKYPIEITQGELPAEPEPAVANTKPASTAVTAESSVNEADHEIVVKMKSEDATLPTATVNLTAPAGYGTVYAMSLGAQDNSDLDTDALAFVRRVDTEGWVPEADVLASGMKKVTSVSVPADGKTYEWGLMYGVNGLVNTNTWTLTASYENETVAVEIVRNEDADATYYTLQGVRVLNPGTGVYVKVANGKAVKVIRK